MNLIENSQNLDALSSDVCQRVLKEAYATTIPQLYLRRFPTVTRGLPWVIDIMGPSGVGKNSLVDVVAGEGLINVARTATTRSRRTDVPGKQDEPEDAYVWMRQRNERETAEEYRQNLVTEYDLVEHDVLYNGNIYGLPRASLLSELQNGTVALTGDNHTGKVLMNHYADVANVLNIFVIPDNIDQLKNRMAGRENIPARLIKANEYLNDAKNVAHFYLHNSEVPMGGESGFSRSANALRTLIQLVNTIK